MRLLHFDSSDKPILTDFRGKPTPAYAILSHRWSDSETLIEDVLTGNYKKKKEGYKKLQFCAERVAEHGLKYFWIDTCCIDRWDNNERSKAINSMFQWYQNAARCYVFLSDVSLSAAAEMETIPCSEWEASFRESAWFTRGWTLQELIAPITVEFFSCEGQRIGDKASLDQLLHSITGIPLTALHNSPLDQFSISDRCQWVKNRNTTEEEDIVYCLLGLLSVSMPITYGEGKESARKRLQAEIEATDSAPSIIPFSQNTSFVGRETQLAELEAKLFSNDQTTTTLAIVGPGGTGKSQLALEVAHRTKLSKKDCSVFWMDASDIDSLSRSYTSIARKFGIPGCDDDQADTKQVVQRCVAALSARHCLMIYDNVESTDLLPSSSSTREDAGQLLADLRPHSKLCSVIFTTTESDTAAALAPQIVITLDKLTPDMAFKMLQNRLTKPLLDAEQQGARHLLRELSHLPLAVVQAAACMNASQMTVQQYQAQFAEHKEAVLEFSDDPPESELRESGLRDTIAATLSLSMSKVRHSNAVAADYLCIAACVDRKDISLEILESVAPRAREDNIRVLERYALITRRPAESAFDIHRLVHQALREHLLAQGRLTQWTQRTVTQLNRVYPDHSHSNRSKWRRLLPHVQYTLSHSGANENGDGNATHVHKRLHLARRCANTLYKDGQYKEAEDLEVEVMQTSKRVLGPGHSRTLSIMNNLASTYFKQGRWNEAEELQVEVIEARKRMLGDEHLDTLSSMTSVALTYGMQGQWGKAEELQVEVMQLSKRVLGNEHPHTLTSINNLASTYWGQGRYSKAEELQIEVLQIQKRVLGDKHPHTLVGMHNLAYTLHSQSRYMEAMALMETCFQSRQIVLGEQHPKTQRSLKWLDRMRSEARERQ